MPVKIVPYTLSPLSPTGEPYRAEGRHILTERVVKATWRPRRHTSHEAYEIVRVVAVEGAVNDWAAYESPISWPAEKTMEEGDKLNEEEAARLFPFLKIERYRR